jgi:transcriptional regulator with XRE-family HTH domain
MSQTNNKELNIVIAQRIRELRKLENVTLEIFYFDTGIHLARIEQGKTNITVTTLQRICSYFNVTLGKFFEDIEI